MFGVDDAAIALIAAGVLSTAGSIYTNRANINAQMQANALNARLALMNNDTQISLANTAHQREVRDLRLAGLNPILSAGGSGSAVPSLQQARQDAAQIQNPLSGLANSAQGIARYFGDQYRTQLAQAKANVEGSVIDNQIASLEHEVMKVDSHLHDQQLRNEGIDTYLDQEAYKALTGTSWRYNKKDKTYHLVIDDYKAFTKALEKRMSGIESEWIDRKNTSWRNALQSVSPFVTPMINNGTSFLRSFGRGRR